MTPAASSDAPMLFDRSGEPIDLACYAELHSDVTYRTLCRRPLAEPGLADDETDAPAEPSAKKLVRQAAVLVFS